MRKDTQRDIQPGALGYLGPAEGSVRPHSNFIRFGVIMAFHETATAWFAHDQRGLSVAGGFHGNPRLRAIYCSDRDRLEA